MAAVQNTQNQIMNRVIHCDGKHYIITTDDYPLHLQRDLDNHIGELRAGHFIEPKPNGYMGFKLSNHAGTLVVNSTDISCPKFISY